MTADFFTKKRYIFLTSILLVFLVCFLAYASHIAYAKRLWMGKVFYFLISAQSDSEAATHTMRLDGGAGYVLADGEERYIVYSVYLSDDSLQAIQAGIGEETRIIKKAVGYLSFKGEDKQKISVYCGALSSLYGGIEVLSQCISKLERGATQQACKRILAILERQFGYMASVYYSQYPAFSNVCAGLQRKLQALIGDTVFCKDLRYVLCEACEAYLQLTAQFSI